jgi:glycosyltransferase involved in cell wall biosynthesis
VTRKLDYLCLQPTRQGQASYAHVNEIVAGLRSRGWEIRLVEPPHPRPGRGDGIRRLLAAVTVQLGYWFHCRFRPAEFVYIRSHFLTLPTALLARLAGSIVVQELNGPYDDVFDAWPQMRPFSKLIEFTARAQLRLADAIVVVTPGLADYVRRTTGRRTALFVIGNGANVDMFRPLAAARARTRKAVDAPADQPAAGRTRAGRTADRPYVVFVGALASWQGIDTVLAATEQPAWPAGVDLVVAGDGRERGRVEAATAADPRIRWLGTIPYAESPALVAASLASLVPMSDAPRCRFGLSPLKLFEGMASGVPVVASDLPGLGDTVREHDCGITFAPDDPAGRAGAVARLAADRAGARAMGERGREAAVARYSWDVRAGETEQLLLGVARKRKAKG